MRKLFLSSVVLSTFAIALTVFQMSCKKEATAQQTGSNYILPPATNTTLGGIIVGSGLTVSSNGTLSASSSSNGNINGIGKILYERYHDNSDNKIEYWTSNYDGTEQAKIPISLPSGLYITGSSARLSTDGKFLFFTVNANGQNTNYIYKCKLDGSELTKVVDSSTNDWYYIVLGTY